MSLEVRISRYRDACRYLSLVCKNVEIFLAEVQRSPQAGTVVSQADLDLIDFLRRHRNDERNSLREALLGNHKPGFTTEGAEPLLKADESGILHVNNYFTGPGLVPVTRENVDKVVRALYPEDLLERVYSW